jgi:hypothetical protein
LWVPITCIWLIRGESGSAVCADAAATINRIVPKSAMAPRNGATRNESLKTDRSKALPLFSLDGALYGNPIFKFSDRTVNFP